MNEEETRCDIIVKQLNKLRIIDCDKYGKISRDFEDIVYSYTTGKVTNV